MAKKQRDYTKSLAVAHQEAMTEAIYPSSNFLMGIRSLWGKEEVVRQVLPSIYRNRKIPHRVRVKL